MYPRVACCFLTLCLLLCAAGGPLPAAVANEISNEIFTEPVVTVIYTTADGEIDEEVSLLDLMLGQFTKEIHLMPDTQLDLELIARSTHLVYFGAVTKTLPAPVVNWVSGFDRSVLVIGENVDQFGDHLDFIDVEKTVTVHSISVPGEEQVPLDEPIRANDIRITAGEELIIGWTDSGTSPLLVRNNTAYYLAVSYLANDLFHFLSQQLFDFFGKTPPQGYRAFIRLEDIHPAAEAHLVAEVGHFLADRGIPFALIVIPVYTNPETFEQVHLRDRPDLVAVLRELQRRGGSVVLHGYTHQYRSSETGEGFEFWDVERNSPIYFPPDVDAEILPPSAFASPAEYEAYIKDLKSFERHYIRSRIEKGMQELMELGLTPLAFEAPHYTMSQQGYSIVAEYFDYILGQVQLGDRNWEFMYSSTYPSQPSFLRGMTVIPETIGYFDIESPSPLEDILRRIEQLRPIKGATIGLFYHPYLGLDRLIPIIDAVEELEDLQWIDLRDLVAPTLLEARKQGLNNPFSLWRIIISHFVRTVVSEGWFSIALWCMAGVAALATGMYLVLTMYNRRNMSKQIFHEMLLSRGRRDG